MKKKILTAIITIGLVAGVSATAQSKELNNIDNVKAKNVVILEEGNAKDLGTGKVINVTTNLRIRTSPSTSASIAGYLYGGDSVKVISKSNGWYEIEAKGTKGFVSADYIALGSNSSGSNNGGNTSTTGKMGQVVNVSTVLRLRQSPSTSGEVIGSLKAGEQFKILEKSNGWYKIDRDNQVGYVHGDYVKEISGSTGGDSNNNNNNQTTGQKTGDGKVVNVTTSLRMRSDANTSASVIGTLYPGNTFEIYGQKNGWYQIKFNGKMGYVHGDYVQKIGANDNNNGGGSTTPDFSQKTGDGKVVNVTTSLRMRSDSNTSASVVGTLYPGNTFEIYGQKSGWYYIKFNGKFGYVHGDYVQKIDGNSNSGNNNAPQSGSYSTVYNSMKQHIGTPYVYGGAGEVISDSLIASLQKKFPGQRYEVPSQYKNGNYRAFDCSGLIQWGFKQAGISLGRTTYDQVKAGRAVSKGDMKPGDLVFFSDLSHVGMYVGNDQWIEAPRTGSNVRVTSVPWSKVGQIRRVL